jgi:hypothetical protein
MATINWSLGAQDKKNALNRELQSVADGDLSQFISVSNYFHIL